MEDNEAEIISDYLAKTRLCLAFFLLQRFINYQKRYMIDPLD